MSAITSQSNLSKEQRETQTLIKRVLNEVVKPDSAFNELFFQDLVSRTKLNIQEKFKRVKTLRVGSESVNPSSLLLFAEYIMKEMASEDKKPMYAFIFFDAMLTTSFGFH